MRKITLAASLIIAPALVQAQSGGHAQAGVNASTSGSASVSRQGASAASSNQASGSVSAGRSPSPSSGSASGASAGSASGSTSTGGERRLSADAQSSVDANLRVARERKLPEEPIRQCVAEGQAKGASDAQIAAASGRTLLNLEGAFDAMVRGGRSKPSEAEVSRGATLLARGYTTVQLEGVAHSAGSERSLSTALDVLTSLQARGVSSANAVAQVESRLAAHAPDAQLGALTTNADASGGLAGALSGSHGSANGAASLQATTGAAGSAAAGAGAGAAAGGMVSGEAGGASATGAVRGVLGKP